MENLHENQQNQPPSLTKPVNPYQAPMSPIQVEPIEKSGLVEPRSLSIGAGWDWIADAWKLFKSEPGLWIISLIVIFVISIVVSFAPIVQILAGATNIFFAAGIGYMAHKKVNHQPTSVSDLFIGFKKNTTQLFLIFLFSSLAIIAIVIILVILGFAFGLSFDSFESNTSILLMAILFLVGVGLIVPIYMATWLSPILVILNDLTAIDAMKMSFKASLRNMLPYFWYSIIVGVLMVLSVIPIGLGFLVTLPLMMLANYTAYRQIMTRT